MSMHIRCFTQCIGKGILSCCKCCLHCIAILLHIKYTFKKLKKKREKPQKGKIEESSCLKLFVYLIFINKETTCHVSCC